MTELRDAVRRATMTLAEAGVESAPVDALHLAAHLRGEDVSETRRLMVLGGVEAPDGYADLVAERANRVPLQHLTGRAYFRGLELEVGPGVFVPRPETELLVDLALRALAGPHAPVVVDLATGSGAIALAVKAECPAATVYAVELTDLAHAWAARNRDRLGLEVTVDRGDARHAYPELVDAVDVVTCNPPYIPDDQVPVDPEVRDHDPVEALYGGSADGLALPLAMAARAAELLRDGGTLVMEHAETQGAALPRALASTGDWDKVVDHVDLLGRPRCVVASRHRVRRRDESEGRA
jgi:release factor glutamine methyltransferase